MEMFSGDDGGQHISLQKNFNQIKMCEEKKKKKNEFDIQHTKTNALLAQPAMSCITPSGHQRPGQAVPISV